MGHTTGEQRVLAVAHRVVFKKPMTRRIVRHRSRILFQSGTFKLIALRRKSLVKSERLDILLP